MNITKVDYPAPAFAMTPRPCPITDLIFHHEAGSLTETPLDIDQQHRNEGWAMIGYNFIIGTDGTVYSGRSLDVIPSAAYGRNCQSVNVSLVGNFQEGDSGYTGPPTEAQISSSITLGLYLHQTIPTIERTIGHRDVAKLFYPNDIGDYATACPGSAFYDKLPSIRGVIAKAMNHE